MSVMCCSNGLALWMEFSVDNTICFRKLVSIFFMWDFWKHRFFSFGEFFPTQSMLCPFVSGFYAKCHDATFVIFSHPVPWNLFFINQHLIRKGWVCTTTFFHLWPFKFLHMVKKKHLYLINQPSWNNDISSMVWNIKQRYFITSLKVQ